MKLAVRLKEAVRPAAAAPPQVPPPWINEALYRLSRLSYGLARRLVRGVSHISLPNILIGRGAVPELIQDGATPEAVARAALVLLEDDRARAVQRAALLEARAQLGEPGAGLRAARAVLREASGGGAP